MPDDIHPILFEWIDLLAYRGRSVSNPGSNVAGTALRSEAEGHVNVDLVPMLLPPNGRKALMIISFVSAILVLFVMTYFSAELVYLSYSKGWTSDTVWGPPLWILFDYAAGVWIVCASTAG